jgi:Chromo (CHRromatin Organisation MOdifier) domain
MPIPERRFDELAMDFVGTLTVSKGFDTILVMTDRLTDYVKLEPTYSTATAQDIAKLVYVSWYRHFGLPKAITSDWDKLFTSNFWKELHKRMKVSLRISSSFHPETDGSSERSNKTMIEAIRHYVNLRHTDWADHLIHVEAAMNNSVNATTGKSPTKLVFGTTLRLFSSPRDLATPIQDLPAVFDYIQRIQGNIAVARDRHAEAKTKQTTYANKKRRPDPDYKVGEKAYLERKDLRLRIKQKGRSAKFYQCYVGPFEISKAEPKTSNYTLELPDEDQIHPKVHARRLKRAYSNDPALFPGWVPPEPPPIDAEDNQYIVEAILDHHTVRRKRQFLVHWEGYSDIEDS